MSLENELSVGAVQSPHVKTLCSRFLRHITAEELVGRSLPELIDGVEAMAAWGHNRAEGETLVRTYERDTETIIEVVTDDMPFLVDSVSAAISRLGRTITHLFHPQLVLIRDARGDIARISDTDVDDPWPPGAIAESWMRIEVERDLVRSDMDGIDARVVQVLGDVRKAVNDWQAMRVRAEELAQELSVNPPKGISASEVQEAHDLLLWLVQDNLTFIGYREYDLLEAGDDSALIPVPGTGLGILRRSDEISASASFAALPPAVRERASEPRVLVLSKANSRSTVHRSAYLDYISVKRFDHQGNVTGEHRFLGLYASSAYTRSVTEIPVLREKFEYVQEVLDFAPGSHSAKDLRQFLETYPRDELFQIRQEHLVKIAGSVLANQERRVTKLYVRSDDYARFVSALVYLPRDRYNTEVRERVENILLAAFQGASIDFTVLVSDSLLARIHYVVRMAPSESIPRVDLVQLERDVAQAVLDWSDVFAELLISSVGVERAARLLSKYQNACTDSYKADFSPEDAVAHILVIDRLGPDGMAEHMYRVPNCAPGQARFTVIRHGAPVSLTRILPILQLLGVEVLDEHPYEVSAGNESRAWVLDFGLLLPPEIATRQEVFDRFSEAFRACWDGRAGIDAFNGLVLRGGVTWRYAMLIRAYARYLRQIGSAFGQGYIEQVVLENSAVVADVVELFRIRFDPEFTGDRESATQGITSKIESALDDVVSLDADRILRSFAALVLATQRTNFYLRAANGEFVEAVAFKFDPSGVPDLPLPHPAREIWVYSTQVEGVHLRFGDVARGGVRWSDRRDDFRTEVLGLVKAQEVKNAVIVPVGAKGGFFPKLLPDPALGRDAWLDEGRAAYASFVSSMLHITDNIVDGVVIPPGNVVRYDGDDPYLVVAADKGTASFSDLANSISAEFDFWLGDAFASGGSVGYDHKAMGITARGAWISVQRHFRELDLDTQSQDFTVVGIGDMSGDVFGNGMLLSEHIRLVAAFDHRHIFIDPDPSPVTSLAERNRLFEIPESSWDDYDRSLISAGGGVFSRSSKSIPLTAEICSALGITEAISQCTPADLISAILAAPVDLLWNGGIGTYVRASTETNLDVGDKSNDAIRITGEELRCQVVGEGGNLGLTQRGRIEAARRGIKLNTDAIDNSAGVDTSDHEVNIKILLDALVVQGELSETERNQLLVEMTDEIAEMVLEDNYDQNVVLGNARRGAVSLVTVHQRMIREMEHRGLIDRAIEFLPDDEEFATRRAAGEALRSPELAVLLAYAKIWTTANLNKSMLASDPWFTQNLRDYFPSILRERFSAGIDSHPLRDQIINTVIVNNIINVGGITFVFRAIEETGASAEQVIRAATVAMEIFGIRKFWDWINSLDNQISTSAQSALQLETRRLFDRATRWFLQTRGGEIDIQAEVSYFMPVIAAHAGEIRNMLHGNEAERFTRRVARFVEAGAPEELAEAAAASLDVYALLDITDICQRTGESAETVVPLYFTLSDRYDVDRTLIRITELPRGDRWSALARQALRSDLYQVIADLTARVIVATDMQQSPEERVETWEGAHAEGVSRARTTLDEITAIENPDLATLSVCLRVLRNLVAQGAVSHSVSMDAQLQ
ncbi:MAG: NAD-glutamate dehydrogenase [Candidatus Nanopelagicales bacterium]|nr:NAD-glutamate dehydrogenase [Candidatus Nanopelagicales bacterium]